MASMFHGASNIHISGSPSFTMISGGYHHYDSSTQVYSSQTANIGGNTFANNVYESTASSEKDRSSAMGDSRAPTYSNYIPTKNTARRIDPDYSPAGLPSSLTSSRAPVLHADFQPWQIQQMDDATREEMHELMRTLRKKIASDDDEDVFSSDGNVNGSGSGAPVQRQRGKRRGERGEIEIERAQSSGSGQLSSTSSYEQMVDEATELEGAVNFEDYISPSMALSDEAEHTSDFQGYEDILEDHRRQDNAQQLEPHLDLPPHQPVVPPHVVQILRDLHLYQNPHHDMYGFN